MSSTATLTNDKGSRGGRGVRGEGCGGRPLCFRESLLVCVCVFACVCVFVCMGRSIGFAMVWLVVFLCFVYLLDRVP